VARYLRRGERKIDGRAGKTNDDDDDDDDDDDV
jgi:hypothetical protein